MYFQDCPDTTTIFRLHWRQIKTSVVFYNRSTLGKPIHDAGLHVANSEFALIQSSAPFKSADRLVFQGQTNILLCDTYDCQHQRHTQKTGSSALPWSHKNMAASESCTIFLQAIEKCDQEFEGSPGSAAVSSTRLQFRNLQQAQRGQGEDTICKLVCQMAEACQHLFRT